MQEKQLYNNLNCLLEYNTGAKYYMASGRERNLIFDLQEDDCFLFMEYIPDLQKYKQLGNSITISVNEEIALFILECIYMLMKND